MEPPLEFRKLMLGFAAFQSATLFAVVTRAKDVAHIEWVLICFAISLPANIAFVLIDNLLAAQKRRTSAGYGYSGLLAIVPACVAIVLILRPLSHAAGYAFLASVTVWFLAVIKVAKWRQPAK
jgi:hypothetical protein